MSVYDDDMMDFGDDDDGEFLTGKLAALGIDEDLELSGGEEENEDPSSAAPKDVAAAAAAAAAEAQPPPPPPVSNPGQRYGAAATRGEERSERAETPASSSLSENEVRIARDARQQETLAATPGILPPTVVAGGGGGEAKGEGVEDGELLEMLEKPLQASRAHPQGSRRNHSSSSRRGDGKRNGRARGRNVTIKECAEWVCERLNEPKYYLMCQVVATIGYNTSKRLLAQVRQTQEAGGMPTADGTRKRTPGGVFFTLLKKHMEPAKLKLLYADEIRVKKENDRARRSAMKRKIAAAEAGEDIMPPRDPPRYSGAAGRDGQRRVYRDNGGYVEKRARATQFGHD